MARKLKLPMNVLPRSSWNGRMRAAWRSMKPNFRGMMPITSRASPSTMILRPMTESSPPNLRCH